MLAGSQPGQHLAGVQIVTRQDRQRIDGGIPQHLLFIAGGIAEAKTVGSVLGAHPGCRSDPHQFQPLDLAQSGQHDRRGEVAGAQDAKGDRL